MVGQGTMICGKFVSSSVAIGLMICGKVLFIPGVILTAVTGTADCYFDDTCVTLISIGSISLISGFGLLVAGIVIYYQVRQNPLRRPLLPQAVVTVAGPAGSYPGIAHPAILYPSSTTYVVPPVHMAQGMPAPLPSGQMITTSYQPNYGFASSETSPPPTGFCPKP